MNALSRFSGVLDAGGNQTLYQIITGLGLTSNLKLCLDAGDSASYDPGVQTAKWLDTSGNGYDFIRGSAAAGDAAEPAFNGAAGGLSSSEYFSFDGGDYLQYDTTNETWMQNLHKDGAILSFICVLYPVSASVARRVFSSRNAVTATGVVLNAPNDAGAGANFAVNNGAGAVLNTTSTEVLDGNAFNFVGFSLNEPAATNNILWKINEVAVETQSGEYSSPSASDVTGFNIGSTTAEASQIASGTRIACLAMWEGTALTAANLSALYDGIKGRFGI